MDLSFEASVRDARAAWGWVKLGYQQLRAKDPISWIQFSISLMMLGFIWTIVFAVLVYAGIWIWALNTHTDIDTASQLFSANVGLGVLLSIVCLVVWILSSLGIYPIVMRDIQKQQHHNDN